MIDDRTADILRMAILEFIRTGEPVSSGEIYRRYRLPVKPATIRNELAELTDAGFLAQPHTSGGRVPTDKGYVFMVDVILSNLANEMVAEANRVSATIAEEFVRGDLDRFVGDLAEELDVLSVGYHPSRRVVSKSGLRELFEELISESEITDLRDVQEIVSDFEMLDDRIGELWEAIPRQREPRVFIGKSPITRSPHLAVIADRFTSPSGEYVIAAIGPKRMNYDGNIKFFMAMKNACDHNQ